MDNIHQRAPLVALTVFVVMFGACSDKTSHEVAVEAVKATPTSTIKYVAKNVSQEKQAAAAEQVDAGEPIATLTNTSLRAELDADKLGTVRKYKKQVVQVSGVVEGSHLNERTGIATLFLEGQILLDFPVERTEQVLATAPGATITARCLGGTDEILPILDGCRFITP